MNTKQMIENLGHIPPPPFFAEENKMTNTVDMKQAVAGATVHFRCGGSAVVDRNLGHTEGDSYAVTMRFVGYPFQDAYTENGFMYASSKHHALDIIRIDPPAFKWDSVKAGMAFTGSSENIYYFIGYAIATAHLLVFEDQNGGLWKVSEKSPLTRAPEHDKVGG